MNREERGALQECWSLQNSKAREAEEHVARCLLGPTACVECARLTAYAKGMAHALDRVDPSHDTRYDADQLFWDDERPGFWKGTNVRRG